MALVVGWLFPTALFAQEAGAIGPELRSVDASVGPVQGGTRVVGLAGAFTAIAVGVDGMSSNAAAVAVRPDYSWTDWDVGFGLDVGIGAWLPKTNLVNTSNSEEVEQRSLLFGSLSFSLQYKQFGLGVSADGRQQGLRSGQPSEATAGFSPGSLSGNFGIVYAAVGYAFLDRDLVVGVGPRVTGLSFVGLSDTLGSSSLRVAGIGYHVGVIYKPRGERFRVGVSYKSSITQSVEESADPQSVWEPDAVELPWEAAVGFAYQLGPRPLNPPFVSIQESGVGAGAPARLRRPSWQLATRAEDADELEEKARRKASRRYHSRPRRRWLLATELRVVGGVDDGVGFTALFGGGPSGSTSATSLSPRFGVETEAIPHWLKLRAGSYWEPARIAETSSRLHGTLGFDVKLFQWNVFGLIGEFDWWQLSAAGDVAENYLNTVVSLGFWH